MLMSHYVDMIPHIQIHRYIKWPVYWKNMEHGAFALYLSPSPSLSRSSHGWRVVPDVQNVIYT